MQDDTATKLMMMTMRCVALRMPLLLEAAAGQRFVQTLAYRHYLTRVWGWDHFECGGIKSSRDLQSASCFTLTVVSLSLLVVV